MTALRQFVNRLYIVDKSRGSIPLGPNMTPAQDRLLASIEADITAGKPVRKVVAKARQMGFSTMTEGCLFAMAMMLPSTKGKVVSHEADSNTHLLGMTRHYWDTFWAHSAYSARNLATNRLSWDNGSAITVSTAKSVASARSQTLHNLHASECAFWDHAETLLTGLNQSMPRAPLTMSIRESTSNGVGNWWHNFCKASKKGETGYDLLFFGWWEHPDYCASKIGLGALLTAPFLTANDEERMLVRYLRARGVSDSDVHDKLLWRREIIQSECLGQVEIFHQEYPTTLEESFVASGRNVFPIEHLRAAYHPITGTCGDLVRRGDTIEFTPNPDGPLRVFRKPAADWSYGVYTVGGDPSWAATGDYSTVQVINRNTWEQVAVYRKKNCDSVRVGEVCDVLGRWYNTGLVAMESTKGGGAGLGVLQAREYPNLYQHRKTNNVKGQLANEYGFPTNSQTKPEAISLMQNALWDRYQDQHVGGYGVTIHDETTFEEMKEYTVLDNGQFGNSAGANHDDCVMALCIALAATIYEHATLINDSGPAEPNFHARPVERLESPAESAMSTVGGVTQAAVMETDRLFRPPGRDVDSSGQDDMFKEMVD